MNGVGYPANEVNYVDCAVVWRGNLLYRTSCPRHALLSNRSVRAKQNFQQAELPYHLVPTLYALVYLSSAWL